MTDYDLISRRGVVVDGSGAAPRRADVAATDGVIAAVGAVTSRGLEETDASDRIVTPAFVDMPTH